MPILSVTWRYFTAKLPDFKRIAKEDFPSKYQDLIERLALPINSHIEQVRNAFNKNIDFTNLSQDIVTLTFKTNDAGQPISELKFKSTLKSTVRGLMPVSLTITSSTSQYPAIYPMISFSQVENIVYIKNIAGLSANTGYSLTFITIS